MADPVADDDIGLFALLEGGEPLSIGFYPEHTAKADLVARVRALAAPREVREVRRGEDALEFVGHETLVVVEPEDEEAAVSFFDRNRDHFDDAKVRVLILLLRGGAGERALRAAPALASFARDASFEITPRPRHADARVAFSNLYGVEPEEWLRRWRAGELSDTRENNHALGEALELTDPS